MTAAADTRVLLIISAHPQLDEQLVDWLLSRESDHGFSSFPIRGHSGDHGHLTIAEQVSGRQKRMRFEIVLDAEEMDGFLSQLTAEFGGMDLHYWATPIVASRDLNSDRM